MSGIPSVIQRINFDVSSRHINPITNNDREKIPLINSPSDNATRHMPSRSILHATPPIIEKKPMQKMPVFKRSKIDNIIMPRFGFLTVLGT
ncbi:hypothetical protein Hgul01_04479 [Herpetosiphon gulosus]|uniref:Uncharacterized protein n=1 Tax=Herpetosiphon gulosus TaxID=1973496 RepID=A0ABP9X5M0_9CHLR